MKANVLFSESIIMQVVHGQHDEAAALLGRAGGQLPVDQAKRLAAFVRIDKHKPEGVASITKSNRTAYREHGTWIGYLYQLGTDLMDIEHWADAEIVLDELIALSKATDEFYFLDEAGLRRGLCLKYLDRKRELECLIAEIPAEAGAFICREDLGGSIRLTRDHLT